MSTLQAIFLETILPTGWFRMRWDLFIFVLLMYLCVSAPYIVGFGIEVTSTETPDHNKYFVVDINWLYFIFM